MTRWLRLGVLVLAAAVVGLASSQEPRSREELLAEIRAEIRSLAGRLEQARKRERTLEDRLASVELELALQRRRVAEAVAARDLAEGYLAASEEAVARLEEAVAQAREALGERLVGLYRLGRLGPLRLLLAVEPQGDLLPALRLMRFLIRRDARLVDRYREQRASLAAERSRLAFQREEAVRWATEERAREQDLIAAKGREAALLAQASENRRGLAARAEELLAKERRLAALMGSLMPGAGEGGAGPPLSDYRGLLDWPLRGTVSERFGTRLDPRYGTRIPYNGIEISGPPGTEVAAVFPGKVLFAAPLEGYGPTVVVLHAGRAFTLYAGLERLLVSSEDVLSLGQPVGISAGRLYFEIRLESRAQDPLDWLR